MQFVYKYLRIRFTRTKFTDSGFCTRFYYDYRNSYAIFDAKITV